MARDRTADGERVRANIGASVPVIDATQRVETRVQGRAGHLRDRAGYILVATDALLMYAAFATAYYVRYVLKVGPQITSYVNFSRYQSLGAVFIGVMLISMAARRAYRHRMSRDVVDEIVGIAGAATLTTGIIVVIDAMLQQFWYSRGVIVYLWILVIAFMSIGRIVYRACQGYLHRQGWGVRRLLVVGTSDVSRMVMQSVMNRPDLGYQLVGFLEHREAANVRDFGRFRGLGTVADLPPLLAAGDVDEVILAVPASAQEEALSVLQLCEQHRVGLKLVPDLFEMSLSRVEIDDIAGIPLLDVREQSSRRGALLLKRAVDVVGASIGLILASPLCAVLAVLIRLESTGPALLRQERVGLNAQRFTCYKFRTMRPNADDMKQALETLNDTDGPIFKIRDDPRCTPLGRRMRRLSLDELPQLWNVLKGDMSLVGPRPALPEEVERYEPGQRRRLEVKPGMTGIWQVSGRSDLGFDEMVLMDITYVDNWSLKLDLRVLINTVIAVLARHGAY